MASRDKRIFEASRIALILADRLVDLALDQLPVDDASEQPALSRGLLGSAGIAMFLSGVLQSHDIKRYRDALSFYMKASAHAGSPGLGLFAGLGGLVAACAYALPVEPRYAGLLERSVTAMSMVRAREPRWRPAERYFSYDLITGRAGEVLAVMSIAEPQHVRSICDYLVWLLDDPTRWCCPHPLRVSEGPVHDLGMAHGLSGIVVALTITAPFEASYNEAIVRGVDMLLEHSPHGGSFEWPAGIGTAGALPSRSAWCYGTPGCAVALIQAARRLGYQRARDIAFEALTALVSSDVDKWHLSGSSLCHGYMGNAILLASVAQKENWTDIQASADQLIGRVIDDFDEASVLGYRTFDGSMLVDAPGLLNGTAGIGLALLTSAGLCDSSWMRYFGLEPLSQSLWDD
jgi:lantibiotic modifying enzyme